MKSLIITLDDLDHPISHGYNHWITWNVTPVAVIPENIPKGAIIDTPIHAEQGLAYGKHCYRGPKPPFNWNHNFLIRGLSDCSMVTIISAKFCQNVREY